MKKIFIVFIFLPLFSLAQESGINFQNNLSWKEIQAAANTQHKFIFVNFCSPSVICNNMYSNVFSLDSVGKFINEHFISVQSQLTRTDIDNDATKNWYADADALRNKYSINVYPTYLFFDTHGIVIHRAAGTKESKDFMDVAKDALDPEKQYYTTLLRYKKGEKDSAFLYKAASIIFKAHDTINAKKIAKDYLSTQTDIYTNRTLTFLIKFTTSINDMGFAIIKKNAAKIDAIFENETAEELISYLIAKEEVAQLTEANKPVKPNWLTVYAAVNKKYTDLSEKEQVRMKRSICLWLKDKKNYQKFSVEFVNQYGANFSPQRLNSSAWSVFLAGDDEECLRAALEWSIRSLVKGKNQYNIDTYANILYRLGKKKEAIIAEQEAINLSTSDEKKKLITTLEKMQAGLPTWN